MSKYEPQLTDLKVRLVSARKMAVILPTNSTEDELASSLALYLALSQAGKEVVIASSENLTVSQTNLFGVGEIKNSLPAAGATNLVLSLEGVVDNQGLVPALEKLDWYPEGSNLNLIFHIVQGQKFEPARITSKYQGSNIDLIFTVGATSLNDLGALYTQNTALFTSSFVVNIDNNQANTNYGQTNLVDSQASSIAEIMTQVIPDLGLSLDQDIASNLLTGIYSATQNLTVKVRPDTFMAAGSALQAGGKVPGGMTSVGEVLQNPQYDLAKVLQIPPQPEVAPQQTSASQEERPQGEYATSGSVESENPAPDWLVPKVFKGGSLG